MGSKRRRLRWRVIHQVAATDDHFIHLSGGQHHWKFKVYRVKGPYQKLGFRYSSEEFNTKHLAIAAAERWLAEQED